MRPSTKRCIGSAAVNNMNETLLEADKKAGNKNASEHGHSEILKVDDYYIRKEIAKMLKQVPKWRK